MKVFGVPKTFAIFDAVKFAPSESEEVFKKVLGGVAKRRHGSEWLPVAARAVS